MAEAALQNARRTAGLLLQGASVLPSLVLLAMGLGGPHANLGQLLQMFSDKESAPLAGFLIGIPAAGLILGHFVKRGVRVAYGFAALAGIGTFFVVFPFPLIGLVLLFQLGRICAWEFLAARKDSETDALRRLLHSNAERLQVALLAAVVLVGLVVLVFV